MSLIWDAVEDRNAYFVESLLAQGWPANEEDPVGQTLLDVAIALDDPEVAELLLNAGGRSFFYGSSKSEGAPDLGTVLSSGHVRVARMLLGRGIDPNAAPSGAGDSPLFHALVGLGEAGVADLLAFGADPLATDTRGRSAANVAAESGRLQALALLERDLAEKQLAAWKDVAPEEGVQEAFGAAILRHDLHFLDAHIAKIDLEAPVKQAGTALFWAAFAGSPSLVMELAARCPDVFKGDKWGRTPLWAAARYGRIRVAEVLIGIGEVNRWPVGKWGTNSWDGTGPLWNAAEQGHTEVVELLLGAGAPDTVNTRTLEGALSAAVRSGHEDTVRLLLDSGAAVDGLVGERRPPIYTARLYGRREIFRLLREAGAKADVSMSLRWQSREPNLV